MVIIRVVDNRIMVGAVLFTCSSGSNNDDQLDVIAEEKNKYAQLNNFSVTAFCSTSFFVTGILTIDKSDVCK